AYGAANVETGEPMTIDTHTRVGSITKTFTGSAALLLEEAGLLSMDDTIEQYWEGIPNGDEITLLMLANMTSGIASYTLQDELSERLFTDPTRIFTAEELIEIGIDASPSFAPGEAF